MTTQPRVPTEFEIWTDERFHEFEIHVAEINRTLAHYVDTLDYLKDHVVPTIQTELDTLNHYVKTLAHHIDAH